MTTIGTADGVRTTAAVPLPGGCNSRTMRNALYLRRGLEFDEWAEIGRRIAVVTDSAAWWIGDWLAFGRRFYPGRYKAALAMTGLDYQTLRNYAWVASRFTPSRRDDRLSFGHHAELASLPDEEADEWLARCAAEHWSRRTLRSELRQALGRGPDRASVAVALAARRDQIQRWATAADTVGTPLEEWIAGALDRAAEAAIAAASRERENRPRGPHAVDTRETVERGDDLTTDPGTEFELASALVAETLAERDMHVPPAGRSSRA
jgi:hypothetical protein